MSKQKVVVFCLVFLLSFAVQNIYAQDFQLSIDCVDSISGAPISNCKVTDAKLNLTRLSNQLGHIQIQDLPSGKYLLGFEANGYHPFQTEINVNKSMFMRVQLCPLHVHLHEVAVTQIHTDNAIKSNLYAINPIVNKEQIFKANALNWTQLLKSIPGVYLIQTGPANSIPVIRGFHTNRLVFVQQDVRLYNQQWGLEHAPELATTNIDRIQLMRGPFALKYGADAFGGVLVNWSPSYLQYDGINGQTQLGFHTNNLAFISAGFVQFKHKKIATQLDFSYKKAGDSQSPQYVISNTGFETMTFQNKLSYQLSKHTQVENIVSYFQSQMGIATAAHIGSSTDIIRAINSSRPLFIAPFTYQINKPYQAVTHQQMINKLVHQFSKFHQLQLVQMVQFNQRKEFDKGVAWNKAYSQEPANAYELLTNGANLNYKYQSLKWNSEIGVELNNGKNITSGIQIPFIPNYSLLNVGTYLISKLNVSSAVIEASIRYDQKKQVVYFRDNNNQIITARHHYDGNAYGLAVSLPVSHFITLNVSGLKSWRAPSINEMYSNGLHNSLASVELGNPNLLPEKALNIETGMQLVYYKSIVKANVFMNAIDAFIFAIPTGKFTQTTRGSFPTFQFQQLNARFQGFELSFTQLMGSYFKLNAQYQFLDAYSLQNHLPIYGTPPNQFYTSLSFSKTIQPKQLKADLNLDWNYVARKSNEGLALDFILPPPAYHLFHVGAQLNFNQRYTIQFTVKNVFNTLYRDYMNRFRYFMDETGRNISIQFAYQF